MERHVRAFDHCSFVTCRGCAFVSRGTCWELNKKFGPGDKLFRFFEGSEKVLAGWMDVYEWIFFSGLETCFWCFLNGCLKWCSDSQCLRTNFSGSQKCILPKFVRCDDFLCFFQPNQQWSNNQGNQIATPPKKLPPARNKGLTRPY